MESEPWYIGIEESAKLIGIGRDAMYKMVKQPGFPVVMISGKYLIRKDGLLEWMKDREGKDVILD